jgi:hypothetical protein
VDYALNNKKSSKEKFKVRRSKIKHTVIMPGNSRRNREDLVKSELEYFDISDSEEDSSKEEDEGRSLVKRRNSEYDDNPKQISPNNNILIIKNALK